MKTLTHTNKSAGIHVYPDDTNQHLALYHPLSTAPQYTPADPIEETIE